MDREYLHIYWGAGKVVPSSEIYFPLERQTNSKCTNAHLHRKSAVQVGSGHSACVPCACRCTVLLHPYQC